MMYSPYGHRLPNDTATWHPEPLRRGTFGLLSSCFVTIGLCVWTSIHLNLPEPGGQSRPFWKKKQLGARSLMLAMNLRLISPAPVQPPHVELEPLGLPHTNRQPWTIVHGYYGAMGGFAIDISEPSHNFHPKGQDKIILSADDLLFLARYVPESIPDIPESEIVDKSNANGLAKFLVCIQAIWFCVQCMTRLGQRLSISLLELNTFAHALCTLLVYLLWWNKPLDIEEPTLLRGEKAVGGVAYLSLVMSVPLYHWEHGLKMHNVFPSYNAAAGRGLPDEIKQQYYRDLPVKAGYKRLHCGESLHGYTMKPGPRVSETEFVDLSSAQQLQLELSQKFEKDHIALMYGGQHSLTDRISDWTMLGGLREEWDVFGISAAIYRVEAGTVDHRFFLGFGIAGLVYGGLHLTAWSASFATAAQKVLWRTSALLISLSGPGLVLWFAFCKLSLLCEGRGGLLKVVFTLTRMITLVSIYTFLACYLCARVFLVVECFLSIPHLPASVFEVPTWSQYFPHFG